MFSLLSTDRLPMAEQSSVWEYKQMVDAIGDEQRKNNIREGIIKIAEAYGFSKPNAAFQRALGIPTQSALNAVVKRGSGAETVELIIKKTFVSRDWLFERHGEMFPRGRNPSLSKGAKSGSSIEGDIDVLRNLIHVLAATAVASRPDAAEGMIEAIQGLPYGDRGFYLDVTDTIRRTSVKVQAERVQSERGAKPLRAGPKG